MTKTIINDEVLFTCKLDLERGRQLSLCKQSYSDGTCFYSLQDRSGNWKVDHGSRKIEDLIKQMEWEIKIDSKVEKETFYKENEAIKKVYDGVKNWHIEILENMKRLINPVA